MLACGLRRKRKRTNFELNRATTRAKQRNWRTPMYHTPGEKQHILHVKVSHMKGCGRPITWFSVPLMNENLEVYRSFRRVKEMMRETPTMKDSLFFFSPFVWIWALFPSPGCLLLPSHSPFPRPWMVLGASAILSAQSSRSCWDHDHPWPATPRQLPWPCW